MTRDYNGYNIVAEPERDLGNDLFRALIFITSIRQGVSITLKERQLRQGSFLNEQEAELHGVTWAMDWIDHKPVDR